jgi:hypothetical protein
MKAARSRPGLLDLDFSIRSENSGGGNRMGNHFIHELIDKPLCC